MADGRNRLVFGYSNPGLAPVDSNKLPPAPPPHPRLPVPNKHPWTDTFLAQATTSLTQAGAKLPFNLAALVRDSLGAPSENLPALPAVGPDCSKYQTLVSPKGGLNANFCDHRFLIWWFCKFPQSRIFTTTAFNEAQRRWLLLGKKVQIALCCKPAALALGAKLSCWPSVCNDLHGGKAGTCPPQHVCEDGDCRCVPNCTDKVCGSDGCGGSCGTCPEGYNCDDPSGQCVCQPDCDGKTCGDDGCGGQCGTCTNDRICVENSCTIPNLLQYTKLITSINQTMVPFFQANLPLTQYWLLDPSNSQHLMGAIAALESGNVQSWDIINPFNGEAGSQCYGYQQCAVPTK